MPSQILIDGERNAVIKLVNADNSAETAGKVVVDVSALDPVPSEVRIDKIHYQVNGMNVSLSWADTSSPVVIQTLQAGADVAEGCFDYKPFGGLTNNAPGDQVVGDITIETVPIDTTAGAYTIVLEVTKKYAS